MECKTRRSSARWSIGLTVALAALLVTGCFAFGSMSQAHADNVGAQSASKASSVTKKGYVTGTGSYSIKIGYGSKVSITGKTLKAKGRMVIRSSFPYKKCKSRTWKFKLTKKTRFATDDGASKTGFKKMLRFYTKNKSAPAGDLFVVVENGKAVAVGVDAWVD